MIPFFALAAIGLIGMAYKSLFVLTADSKPLPQRVERSLRVAAPAMLAAMIGNLLAPTQHSGQVITELVIAGAVGAVIAYRTHAIGWTLLGGLAVFWPLTVLTGG